MKADEYRTAIQEVLKPAKGYTTTAIYEVLRWLIDFFNLVVLVMIGWAVFRRTAL